MTAEVSVVEPLLEAPLSLFGNDRNPYRVDP